MNAQTTRDAASARIPTDEQVKEFMPLVHRIVAHFVRRLPRSVQREDLVAAGTFGLFQALRTSEHSCPEMFATYARIRIRGSIVDELRRHDWSPRRRRQAAPEAAKAANDTTAPTATAGSGAVVVSLAARRAGQPSDPPPAPQAAAQIPLQVVGFDDLPPTVSLAEDCASPLEDLTSMREHTAVRAAVEELPARERSIIKMRYFDDMPSKAIASTLGLSESRISQLHARATARLKELLRGEAQELDLAA